MISISVHLLRDFFEMAVFFLKHNIMKFSLCLRGLSPRTLASSHNLKDMQIACRYKCECE